ncbi:MAG: hypothetical protein K2M95_02860, partial [Clostridiales bacterium]|nr:hypothetical protein [Clostridiales bacterium]
KLHGLHGEDVLQAEIDSRMLGAILQTQIDSLIPSGGTLGKLSPRLEYVYTYITQGRNMMEAAFSIGVSSLLDGNGSVEKIVSGLLGERALLTLTVDITPKSAGDTYKDSEIAYNGLSVQKTNDILKTIRIFVSDFSRDELLAQVVEPVRDVIDNMSQKIPVKLCSSVIDVDATSANLPAAMQLGSVYEIIKEYEFKEDDDITADDIKTVLEKLETSDSTNHASFETDFVGDGIISSVENGDGTHSYSYSQSLNNVLGAYYVKDPQAYTAFDEVFGDDGVVNKNNFDATKFDFDGTDGLFYDARPTAQMMPRFTQGDLAALLLKKMEADDDKSGSLKLYEYLKKVKGAKVTQDACVTLYMALDAADLLGDGFKDKARLLPADRVYLTATVYIGEIFYYDQLTGEPDSSGTPFYRTVLSVNGMTDAEFAKFMLMIDSLNGKNGNQPLDFTVKARDIGAIVYRELRTVEDSLGGAVTYGDGYVELPSVYDFIKKATVPSSDATAEEVRAALQGLAAAKTGSSAYNYDAMLFAVNLVQSEAITLPATAITDTQTLNDNVFGRALKSGFTVQAGASIPVPAVLPDTAAYELRQFNVLRGTGVRDTERREALDGYNGIALSDSVTYLEFTFTVRLKELAPTGSKMLSALPEDAYITLLFEKTTTGIAHCEGYYRLNALSHDALSLLLDMANIDVSEIDAQIARCATAMAQYGGATFGAPVSPEGTAFGSVSFVPPSV